MDPHLGGYNPTQQQGFGLRRALGLYITARNAKFGLGIVAALLVSEVAFRDEYKPSTVAGRVVGNVWKGEQDAARSATVETTRQTTAAQQQEAAKAQQQVIVAQSAQQYGLMTAMPSVVFSWFLQGKCYFGLANADQSAAADCRSAQTLNNQINSTPGTVSDSLGATRTWDGAPRTSGPVPAAADAPPLDQGEYGRMARLERYLDPAKVAQAQKEYDRTTNRGERRYLGRLTDMAGEVYGGSGSGPRVIYEQAPRAPGPLPQSVRSN